MDQLTTR